MRCKVPAVPSDFVVWWLQPGGYGLDIFHLSMNKYTWLNRYWSTRSIPTNVVCRTYFTSICYTYSMWRHRDRGPTCRATGRLPPLPEIVRLWRRLSKAAPTNRRRQHAFGDCIFIEIKCILPSHKHPEAAKWGTEPLAHWAIPWNHNTHFEHEFKHFKRVKEGRICYVCADPSSFRPWKRGCRRYVCLCLSLMWTTSLSLHRLPLGCQEREGCEETGATLHRERFEAGQVASWHVNHYTS